MDREAAYKIDGLFIGADGRDKPAFQTDVDFGDSASFPPHDDVGGGAGHGNVHFVEKGVEQFFSIPVGRGGSFPYRPEIGTQGTDLCTFQVRQGTRTLTEPQFKFCFGGRELCEPFLPFGFQRAGNKAVLRFHGPVTAFRTFALVAGLLYLEAPLGARGFVISFKVLFGE